MEIINEPVQGWAFDIHSRERARFTFADGSYIEVQWAENGDGGIEVTSNRHSVDVRPRAGNVVEVGQRPMSSGEPEAMNRRRKR